MHLMFFYWIGYAFVLSMLVAGILLTVLVTRSAAVELANLWGRWRNMTWDLMLLMLSRHTWRRDETYNLSRHVTSCNRQLEKAGIPVRVELRRLDHEDDDA